MDQLNEPKFNNDKTWRRKLLDTNKLLEEQTKPVKIYGTALSAYTCYRYIRNVTFYKYNYLTTLIVVPLLIASSFSIVYNYKVDPHINAAIINNKKEDEFINSYKNLYIEAKKLGLNIPDKYIYF